MWVATSLKTVECQAGERLKWSAMTRSRLRYASLARYTTQGRTAMAAQRNFGSTSPVSAGQKISPDPSEPPRTLVMCLAPAPGLPNRFSSAAVRAEAGESAEMGAGRVSKQEESASCETRRRELVGDVGVGEDSRLGDPATQADSSQIAQICNKNDRSIIS
jgi:hypothetical protein